MKKNNITAEDVAGLAGIFGVVFTQEDINTLQNWVDEEDKARKNIKVVDDNTNGTNRT